ncbi:HhH-GPD superfamily base excision DNA repair protein [Ceratobasidium sp. AG-Ba]|nr:HhH-GPD superfamily base excision DNA repair protein [Ceratobasidium sp. AG-Ba]
MPPKSLTSAYKPTQGKLENTSVTTAKRGSKKRAAGTKLDFDYDALRKRQRVEFDEPTSDEESYDVSDDDSSLTSLEPSVFDDEVPGWSTPKAPCPQVTTLAKSPLKQLKLEDMSPKFKSKRSVEQAPLSPSPRKKKAIAMELDKPHPAPPNWERQYKLIEEMRANVQAPVDTMGCCSYMSNEGDPKDQRFGALVSLMLSAQTRDEITSAAVANLRRALPGGLTISSILAADPSVISGAIKRVSYHQRKTEYLQATAATLRDRFDGDVPKTVDELCSLRGVGPKMAILALQVAWNINVGVGVDVHVHRITNRLGWHDPPTNTPEQTRLNLQSWLPHELHKPINPLLVGFGQTICLPFGPRCGSCMLATEGLCPSARPDVSAKGRKPILYAKKEKTEISGTPDLDVTGLVHVEKEAKQEEWSHVGEPRMEIQFEG